MVKTVLSINMDEIETIKEATDSVYTRLTAGLGAITNNNGWIVLSQLKLLQYLEIKKEDDLTEVPLDGLCPNNIEDDKVKCICGKTHLKKLAIMSYKYDDWDKLILGSECIKTTMDFIAKLEGIPHLKAKLKFWIKTIKEGEKKYKCIDCIGCGEKKVKKDYHYKNEARNLWCKDCCYGGRVKCSTCPKFRVYLKDWKGIPMKQCYSCYCDALP